MINFAHRGASAYYPENTVMAFKEALKAGATGIELDVHKTKDNKLVVIHDEDIERTFLGKGLVKYYTLEELKEFKCRNNNFRENKECIIPKLEEVLNLVQYENITLNIEVKTDKIQYEGIEEDVIKLIKSFNMDERVILSSFNHESILRCKNIDSTIKTGLLYYKPIDNIVEYAKEHLADALHPDIRLVNEELIKSAHENGLIINIYTVNSPIYMRRLIEANVDGIFTDYTELLKDVLEGII